MALLHPHSHHSLNVVLAARDLTDAWPRGATSHLRSGGRPRGAVPHPRSGAAAEIARLQRHRSGREELCLPDARGGGREEELLTLVF